MISRIKRALGIPPSALRIQLADEWSEEWSDTRWTFAEETSEGIRLEKEYVKQYRNMESGEKTRIVRKDSRTEWFDRDGDLPERARRAYDDGAVYWEDLDNPEDELPQMWGLVMSNSGSVWRRDD